MFKSKLGSPVPSRSSACQCSRLLLLQSPLFCCCCFVSLVSLSTVKQRPGPVLPPWGTTDYCKKNQCACVTCISKKSCGASTVCTSYSDDIISIKHTVCCPSRMCKNWSILWALLYTKAISHNFPLRTPSCHEEVRKSNNVFSRYIFCIRYSVYQITPNTGVLWWHSIHLAIESVWEHHQVVVLCNRIALGTWQNMQQLLVVFIVWAIKKSAHWCYANVRVVNSCIIAHSNYLFILHQTFFLVLNIGL